MENIYKKPNKLGFCFTERCDYSSKNCFLLEGNMNQLDAISMERANKSRNLFILYMLL